MVIQLVTWPWKTPIINLADGLMNMLLILLLAVGSAFLDALEGQVKATYSVLAVLILGSLYSVTFVLLCLVLAAFFHKSAMGHPAGFRGRREARHTRGDRWFLADCLEWSPNSATPVTNHPLSLERYGTLAEAVTMSLRCLHLGSPPRQRIW